MRWTREGSYLWRWVCGVGACAALMASVAVSCTAQDGPCLDRVYKEGQAKTADYSFDLKFDKDKNGRSFSCVLEISASAARKALDTFRFGLLYDSEEHINEVVRFPLDARVYRTRESKEKPRVLRIRNFADWLEFKKAHFDRLQIAQIACANLRNVNVIAGRSYGFMIGNGRVWFQRSQDDPKIRVTALNLHPVDSEALVDSCAAE